MNFEEIKKLGKYFILTFLLSFLLVNWDTYGWIFSYRAITSLFERGASQEAADIVEEILFENASDVVEEERGPEVVLPENVIKIPKIGISVPVIFFGNPNESQTALHKSLDRGVIHYPKSVLPGETGQTILLGHSAPPNWPKIKYDWVFNELDTLNTGDEVAIQLGEKEYVYRVLARYILDKGDEPPYNSLIEANNMLILISCWPPGKNYKRVFVEAVLEDMRQI